MLHVAVARSFSDDNARYILPVLWMTSCLPIVGAAKAALPWFILKVTHQGAAPGRTLTTTIALLNLVRISDNAFQHLWSICSY